MNIYIQSPKYCTYLTVYSGNKLPSFYIGSSSIENVKNGYCGSVKSKKYSKTWKQELKENPYLFKTIILEQFYSRKNALFHERLLQIKFDVVRSEQFVNMAIAAPNGFFGMDTSLIVSGKNHWNYGKRGKDNHSYGKVVSDESRKKQSIAMKGKVASEETRKKLSIARIGDKNPNWGKHILKGENHPNWGKVKEQSNIFGDKNPSKIKCCCLICGKETNPSGLTKFHKH